MRNVAWAMLPLMLAATLTAGCAGMAHKEDVTYAIYKYYDYEIEYKTTVRILIRARKGGLIKDDIYKWIDPLVDEGNELLKEIHADLKIKLQTAPAGEKIQAEPKLVNRLLNILEKLAFVAAEYKGGA